MKKSIFIFLFFSILPKTIEAQKNEAGIHLSPLSLVDFYNGSHLKSGLYFKFDRFVFMSDFGAYSEQLTSKITLFESMNGIQTKQSFNWTLDRNGSFFLGVHWLYKEQQFKLNDITNEDIHYQTLIRKTIQTYNLHLGYRAFFGTNSQYSEHFGLWLEIGLGARHQTIQNTLNELTQDSKEWYDSMHLSSISTGKRWVPNADCSIRLFWRW